MITQTINLISKITVKILIPFTIKKYDLQVQNQLLLNYLVPRETLQSLNYAVS